MSDQQENPLAIVYTLTAIFGVVYLVFSFLLIHPHKWRGRPTRKNVPKSAKCIGHRGSRLEELPENTIAAFKQAIRGGADVLECDVYLTTDNEVVVHHDDSLLRMTGVDKMIYDCSYKELPKIKVTGKHKDYTKAELECIPRLWELFDILPENVNVIIEFKQESWDIIKLVHQIIKDKKKVGSVFWFSLIEKINRQLRQYDADIPTVTSIPGMLTILLQYYLCILPFVEIKEAVFGIPLEEISLAKIRGEKALEKAPDWIKRLLAYVFRGKPPFAMLSKQLFTHLRRRGVYVLFLGVNTEEELRLAERFGVTGVISDRVSWLTKTMEEKGIKFKELYE
ncbi:hypothetical protein EON65_39500 [archaeon]|nr:MAG: hypothetical protein EON65_39500 [archaeon]